MKFLLRKRSEPVRKDAIEFLTKWNDQILPSKTLKKLTRSTARSEILTETTGVEMISRDMYETYLGRESEHVINEPLRVVKLRELVKEVKERSVKTSRMIVDYGFWFMTYNLAVTDAQVQTSMDAMKNEKVDFFMRQQMKIHHH